MWTFMTVTNVNHAHSLQLQKRQLSLVLASEDSWIYICAQDHACSQYTVVWKCIYSTYDVTHFISKKAWQRWKSQFTKKPPKIREYFHFAKMTVSEGPFTRPIKPSEGLPSTIILRLK